MGLHVATSIFVGIVAFAHICFGILEAFLWTTAGVKLFAMDRDLAISSYDLAKNQGMYNWILAAGCIWSLTFKGNGGTDIATFFTLAVCFACFIGSLTVNRGISYKQGGPAMIALWLLAGLDGGSYVAAAIGTAFVVFGFVLGPIWSTKRTFFRNGHTLTVKFP